LVGRPASGTQIGEEACELVVVDPCLTEQEVAARFEAEEAGARDPSRRGRRCVVEGEDVVSVWTTAYEDESHLRVGTDSKLSAMLASGGGGG
jgi:hypothetical protein